MRLSFITQFKIEFLISFTSCRKVLGKMPAIYSTYILKTNLLSETIVSQAQPALNCSNSGIITIEQSAKYAQS